MPVKKRVSKKPIKDGTASRGRPAKRVNYEAPLLEVFDSEEFAFDPEHGWDEMDRSEAVANLRKKYGKAMTDVIADCFDADPEMEPDHIIAMFKQKLNIDIDRQYIYTSKMRWKRNKEYSQLQRGVAVPSNLGANGDLLPILADLVKRFGLSEVKTAMTNLEMVAAMLRE